MIIFEEAVRSCVVEQTEFALSGVFISCRTSAASPALIKTRFRRLVRTLPSSESR